MENKLDNCATEVHHHENDSVMNVMNKDSISDDERIQLTSFAHGLRGLIAELQRADEEARAVVSSHRIGLINFIYSSCIQPPMTSADGTPLSPITEADELPLESDDDGLSPTNADSSFDSELSGETIGNPPTPTLECSFVLQHLRDYHTEKNTRQRSVSSLLESSTPPRGDAADHDRDTISIATGLELDEQVDDPEQDYYTAESNSAPSLPSFSCEDMESEYMDGLIPGTHLTFSAFNQVIIVHVELEDFHASRAATPIPFQMDRHIDACNHRTETGNESESESESTTGSVGDLLEIESSAVFSPKERVLSPRFRAASFATAREDPNVRSHLRSASDSVTGHEVTPAMKANWQGSDSLRVCL